MKTNLREYTVGEIIEGFSYSDLDQKGIYGLNGKLVIQPEYQRHYIYGDGKKDTAVVRSLLQGHPLGLIYFNKPKPAEGVYELLDGQQRITSIGRYIIGKFAVQDGENFSYFSGLPKEKQEQILQSKILTYICEGSESEIREWFKTINTAGVALNDQELLNAVYSGSFISLAKAEYSNGANSNNLKWAAFISGNVLRQDYLATALEWVSGGKENVEAYMSLHRHDSNIAELQSHFEAVIKWVSDTFTEVEPEMSNINWGALYSTYKDSEYDLTKLNARVKELYGDSYVKNRKGIWEYVLGGETEHKLLDVRVFDDATKKSVYAKQKAAAEAENTSNCSYCAIGHDANKDKIWHYKDMDADHVSAWSKGGATDKANCEMLCKPHNRAKGNK